MSRERGPFPFMTAIGILVVALVVTGIDRITHSDVIAAFATVVILGVYVAWWFWGHRYL